MIYKCTNCDAALTYNPSLRLLECSTCGSFFSLEEFAAKEEDLVVKQDGDISGAGNFQMNYSDVFDSNWDDDNLSSDDSLMECNIYSCTTCGAELAINGVEASTFCAYCGQPTIVFNRVSKEKKPKYIIPFQFNKEQAIGAIRQRLNKGFFIPKEIKNFEVERVRGIYVPFWKVDLYYHDRQYLRGTVGSGKHKKTRYFYREAEADFTDITVDASIQLADESSQRLEPFDLSRMKPFDVAYLSGFYADTYDFESEPAKMVAKERARNLYDSEVKKSVRASSIAILSSDAEVRINDIEYLMLPVWFMTFRYQNEPYTILVNGQTGKIIGAVPYFKRKVVAMVALFTAILTPVLSALIGFFLASGVLEDGEVSLSYLFVAGFVAFFAGFIAWGNFYKVSKSIKLTKATTMNNYVKNRQEV